MNTSATTPDLGGMIDLPPPAAVCGGLSGAQRRSSASPQTRRVFSSRPALVDAGGPPAVRADHLTGWRDVVQSLAHDVADVPLLPRLVAGQVVLALGYASLCASLALRERMRERMREAPETHTRGTLRLARVLRRHPLLSGMVAAAGVTFVWGSLALASRTRTAPVVSAIFAYGRELRQYVPPLRSPAYAA